MAGALFVFVNGTLGVFVGMTLVYLTVRVIAALVGRLQRKGTEA